MGALSLGGTRIALGGLGRRTAVDAGPDRLAALVPSSRARLRLHLSVTADEDDLVAVPYTDPRGGTRTVTHAALAALELTVHRLGRPALTLSSRRGGYEYGASQPVLGLVPRALPEG
jgi:hypothetical protein